MDFMKTARFWVGLSLVITLVGLGSLIFQGLNKGIDFTGGSTFDLTFKQHYTQAEMTSLIKDAFQVAPAPPQEVQTAQPDQFEYLIRTPDMPANVRQAGIDKLRTKGLVGDPNFSEVSAAVSSELVWLALKAIFVAALIQILYITIRFEFRFAISAVIALLHDGLIILGLMSLFRVQVDQTFMAAVLTVLGYSMNDTIVIFDRIRENLRTRKKGEDLEALVNKSINQSIWRSLFTVLTVEITLLSIFFFGGESTKTFAMALIIGVTSGAYSSIFIASPLWLWWTRYLDTRKKSAPKTA